MFQTCITVSVLDPRRNTVTENEVHYTLSWMHNALLAVIETWVQPSDLSANRYIVDKLGEFVHGLRIARTTKTVVFGELHRGLLKRDCV